MKNKICRKCNGQLPETEFVAVNLEFNPRARNCVDCVVEEFNSSGKASAQKEADELRLILYGVQLAKGSEWLSFVAPGEYCILQRPHETECLYCGIVWGVHVDRNSRTIEVIDPVMEHMDPSFLGGANTPVNIAFSCAKCNSKKGKKPFSEWLKKLTPDKALLALNYYIKRHQRHPEMFVVDKNRATEMYYTNSFDLIKDSKILSAFSKIMIISDVPEREREQANQEIEKADSMRVIMIQEAKEKFQNFPWLTKI